MPLFPQKRFCRSKAFTLVELLAVIAVIALLLSLSAPGVSSVLRSRRNAEAVSQVVIELEAARQYASGQNTYVWVALSAIPSGSTATPLRLITVASNTGMGEGYGVEEAWNAATINLTNNTRFTQIRKMVTLQDYSLTTSSVSPPLSSSPAFSLSQAGTNYTFPRVIMFTPNGEAKVAPDHVLSVLLRLAPQELRPDDVITEITLNGLTGTLQTSEVTP